MRKHKRYCTAFILLFILTLFLLILNLCIGSVSVPLLEIPKILAGNSSDAVSGDIVIQIRIPRALAAAILGGALALSGYLLQTFFHCREIVLRH